MRIYSMKYSDKQEYSGTMLIPARYSQQDDDIGEKADAYPPTHIPNRRPVTNTKGNLLKTNLPFFR